MKDLPKRTLTALVFGAVMIGGIIWNQYSFMILTTLICAGCLWEYLGIIASVQTYQTESKALFRFLNFVTGLIVFALIMLSAYQFINPVSFALILPLLFIVLAFELYAGKQKKFQNSALNLLGIIYIALPLGLLHYIVMQGEGNWFPEQINIVFGILLLVWTNDSMAYIVGSLIGKNKLFPSVSPKKSWEGFIGGALFCFGVGFLLSKYFTTISLQDWLVIAGIVSILGTIGDLVKSLMKRNLEIKDSGNILPGHGGLIDRFDAFIYSIPFVFAYLKLFA